MWKWNVLGKVKGTLLGGGGGARKSMFLLEGSRNLPVRATDKNRVEVSALGWLEAVAWDRGNEIFIFWINVHIISEKIIVLTLTAKWPNFDEIKPGGMHENHAVAIWLLGSITTFALKTPL
jgi:hypothetical protein